MKAKTKKIFRYLLIPLPFLIYMGLMVTLSFLGAWTYMQGLLYAVIFLMIRNPNQTINTENLMNFVNKQMTNTLIPIMLFIIPILTGVFFYFWYRMLIKKEARREPQVKLFTVKNILLVLLISLGLQLEIAGLMELILPYFKELTQSYNELMEQINKGNPILMFVSLVIVAPISEELTFRGVILKKARYITPFVVANILQALLFGIAHMNIIQGVYAFGGGLAMGYVAYKFKTIKASIMLHMFFNGLNYVLMTPTSKLYQILYVVFGAALTIIALIRIKKVSSVLKPDIVEADTNIE